MSWSEARGSTVIAEGNAECAADPSDRDLPQRSFYERGYSRGGRSGGAIVRDFTALPTHSRIARAAAMIRDADGSILDVGCGAGALLWWARTGFSQLCGVDIARTQLEAAQAWAVETGTAIEFERINVDVEDLPFPSDSFDVVACLVILEFVFDPGRLVTQMARVLKPNGVLVASVGNIASWRNRLRVIAGLPPRTTTFAGAVNGGALHTFTASTLVSLLSDNGFHVELVSCCGRMWRLRRIWPSLLGDDIMVRAVKLHSQ